LIVLHLYLFLVGESCLLVSWCASDRWGMACSNEDRGRSRRPGAEDRGWSGMVALTKHQFHAPTCRVNIWNNHVFTLSTNLVLRF
jgi:hypothetical protein